MRALTPLLAPDAADDANAAHQRGDVRNNMFVTAALSFDGGSAPVRIRNMSRCGALIESASIPPENTQVRLDRGSLGVCGLIVWRRENRAGIRFEAAIEVAHWLPGGSKPTEQENVDGMIHACRTEAPHDRDSVPAPRAAGLAEAITQLHEFRDTLNVIAGELASDPAIAAGHPTALQTIDVTAQKLGKLASLLGDGD